MAVSVEGLSASLVREYLSRKGLKMTLEKLDEEYPRHSESIGNRVALARALHIERLMKRNKELSSPHRTMVEVIVQSLIESSSSQKPSITTGSKDQPSPVELRKLSEPGAPSSSLSSSLEGMVGRVVGGAIASPTHQEAEVTPRRGLRQQRSVSTGVLGKSSPTTFESYDEKRSRDNHRTHTSVQSDDNPLTRSLDDASGISDDRTKDSTSGSHKDTSTSADSITSEDAKPQGSRRSSHPKRKEASTLSVDLQAPRATGVQRVGEGGALGGIRATSMAARHQKFKPRSFVESEPFLKAEEGEDEAAASSGQRQSKDQGGADASKKRVSLDEQMFSRGNISASNVTSNTGGMSMGGREGKPPKPRGMRSFNSTGSLGRQKQTEKPSVEKVREAVGDVMCEDLEDLDMSFGMPSSGHTAPVHHSTPAAFSTGRPIAMHTAKALRELLFGTAKGPSFNAEWKKQNLFFCDLPGLEFGLVQHKGGPCGVLAPLQAYIIKHLVFSRTAGEAAKDFTNSPRPSVEERREALEAAMAEILWRAGGEKQAVVALSSATMSSVGAAAYKPDHITEKLVLYTFSDNQSLKVFLTSALTVFQDSTSCGCILFLYSAILSKGIESIRDDMDDRNSQLMGAHGYCTQEMVNLLLTGYAVSNVFDGVLDLDTGGSKTHMLRGIPAQSDVGFLSLFEHYGSCTVGSNYKEPVLPIWVVCSESHFTVLFSLQRQLLRNWRLEKKFDLFYYDQLAHQDDIIRLTVDNSQVTSASREDKDDLVPPLEHCIRTKWKTAVVDWHGTEPIL